MTTSARIVIQPTTGWRAIDLREMWAYRDLLAIVRTGGSNEPRPSAP